MRNIFKIEVKNNFVVKGISLEGVKRICEVTEIGKKTISSSFNEIFIIDYTRSNFGLEPNFKAVKQISNIYNLPITYGGGIQNAAHVYELARSGASRFYINSAFRDPEAIGIIEGIASVVGRQALILGLEVRHFLNSVTCYNSSGREVCALGVEERIKLVEKGLFGEVILTDIENDGTGAGFNFSILDSIPRSITVPKLICGGINGIDKNSLEAFGIDGVVRCSRFLNLNN